MKFRDPANSMWLQALKALERADQFHRHFFRLGKPQPQGPVWEPPADIFETRRHLLIQIALPGVDLSNVSVVIKNHIIHVVGERPMTMEMDTVIRRLEIPYGRFEKQIGLPNGHYQISENILENGCLRLVLSKR